MAQGDLTIGDSSSVAGFFSNGELYTNEHTVTIRDENVGVLGSLNRLGNTSGRGTLTAGTPDPGFLLEEGKNLLGRGDVNGNFKNRGDVAGDGQDTEDHITFNSPYVVSGTGTFTNTLVLGTFNPGDSPAIVTGTNQGFGGIVELDLGGTTPGFSDENHDQIVDQGTILLTDDPTIDILPWNDFVPEHDDEFIVMTWDDRLDGTFAEVAIDPWFTDRKILFNSSSPLPDKNPSVGLRI